MSTIKFDIYTQYEGDIFEGTRELEWNETIEDEVGSYDEAVSLAKHRAYGCSGEFVRVYIDGKFYCEYEQR